MTHSLLRLCAALIPLGSLTLVTQASPASTPTSTPMQAAVTVAAESTATNAVLTFGVGQAVASEQALTTEAVNASFSPTEVVARQAGEPVVHPWRRLLKREVTHEVVANANAIIRAHHQIGEEVPFMVAGEPFLARIEEHYHPPGGDKFPWGPHPGVSVFVARPAATP